MVKEVVGLGWYTVLKYRTRDLRQSHLHYLGLYRGFPSPIEFDIEHNFVESIRKQRSLTASPDAAVLSFGVCILQFGANSYVRQSFDLDHSFIVSNIVHAPLLQHV